MPSARTRSAGARGSAAVSAPKLGGGTVKLDAGAFTGRFNMPLVHQAVRAELNARRRGTASTKTRGQVSGGGAKPWRQKGTGRARAGSSRSPLWAGGGTVFGPSPRRYTFKVNRKERRAALRGALAAHAERQSVAVFDAAAFTEPATRQAASLLGDWGARTPTLVILADAEAAAGKSFRNLARVQALPVEAVGVADVVGAASLLISEAALPTLVDRAAKAAASDATTKDLDAPDSGATGAGTAGGGRGQKGANSAQKRHRSTASAAVATDAAADEADAAAADEGTDAAADEGTAQEEGA